MLKLYSVPLFTCQSVKQMLYIEITSKWHLHLSLICKLLDIDSILIISQDHQHCFDEIHDYYQNHVAQVIKRVMGYNVDFGSCSNFIKRNFTICNTRPQLIVHFPCDDDIETAERNLFSYLVEHKYIPDYVLTWREFAVWAYELVTHTTMTRDLYLHSTHAGLTWGIWLLLCHFTVNGRREVIPINIFKITTPNILVYSPQRISDTEIATIYMNGDKVPHVIDIIIWINDTRDLKKIDWNEIIYLSCRECLWSSSGCLACNMEYVNKRHKDHAFYGKLQQWVFGKETLMKTFIANNCDLNSTVFKDIHIKTSKAIIVNYE